MGENQKRGELSLVYILNLLLKKVKWLILIALIGAFVGAGAGILTTYDKKYYGTTVKYFVNPTGKTSTSDDISTFGLYGTYGQPIMDSMVTLLSQQSFSAMMVMSKVDDLYVYIPEKGADTQLNALIDDANAKRDAYAQKQEEVSSLQTAWENETDATEKAALLVQLTTARSQQTEAKTLAVNASNKVYNNWTRTNDFRKMVERVNKSVSFSYITQADSKNNTDLEALALPFIYVNVSVLNDEEFANLVYTFINISVPPFVEENMWKPGEYTESKCDRMNIFDDVQQTNQGETTSTAVKYGVLLALGAAVVACLIFVYIDLADKRIRNLDQVSEDLQIPLLGVIPTILVEETQGKANAEVKK